jgi:DNA-binding CsgD family transcriptional regulator
LTLAAAGREREARELAAEELALARDVGRPRAVGIALAALARAAPGDREAAIELLGDAVDTLEASPDRLQEAHARAALGAALLAAGRREEARGPLSRAVEAATALGAEGLAERAAADLRASGARPRRVALSGAAALTPAEERCARLAASGLSNREVAQRLFVTVRAVEMHLTSAYKKLGISSRRELASALDG